MRHGKKINHLSRTSSHRKAMLANMASSLILKKRINTTLAKAKALRKFVEPLITRSKDDSTHSRRMAFRYLKDKVAVTELFREVSTKVSDRPGGYTRIIKMGNRLGDQAEMALIELVDYNDLLIKDSKPAAKKRSRRGRKSGAAKATAAATITESESNVTEEDEDTIGENKMTESEVKSDSQEDVKSEKEDRDNEKSENEEKDSNEKDGDKEKK